MSHQPAQRGGGEDAEHERSASSLIHRIDLIVALIILVVCALLFWRTFAFGTVPEVLAQGVQPTTFPRLLLITIAAMTLYLPFEYRNRRKKGVDLDSDRRSRPQSIVYITAAVLLIGVGIMPWLGTYVGLIILAAVLPLLWGERRYKILVPYVLLLPTALMWLFAGLLQVSFLPGIIGYLFR